LITREEDLMLGEIISRGVACGPALIPADWDERTLVRFEDGAITITFKNGTAAVSAADTPDAEAVIEMSKKRLCDCIDGSIDFMTIWRELAEPSPTDRRYIKKGSGAKLITVVDLLSRVYRADAAFKKLVNEYKSTL